MIPSIWLSHYARPDDVTMVKLSYRRIYEEQSDPRHGDPKNSAYQYGEYRPISVLCMVLNPGTEPERILSLARETADRVRRVYPSGVASDPATHLQWAGTWYHDLIMVYFEFLEEEVVTDIFSQWARLPDFKERNRAAISGIKAYKRLQEFLK